MIINVVEDFTDTPGARYKTQGSFSGEEFRDKILYPKFIKALKESNLDPIGKKITIVGAGGAVTAIEIQAALDGVAEISIFNRKDEFYNQALINCKNINENTQSKAKVFDWADHEALRKEMNESGCIGSISELYDSKTPYLPKGAFAQGWSVAEVFRIIFG